MVDNQMLQSFSDCLDLQLFMQHQQEEKVKENQMFYKYLQNQLQILTSELDNDNLQKQLPKQNKNPLTIIKTPQSQQRLSRYLEMKSIIDINFKQNIQFYIKQRELIKLLKERLYFVNSMIANKRQVYEIDLESQETRILVRDFFEFKEDNIELKNNNNNNLSDNFNNNIDFFSDSFDQSNKGAEEDQDKMDDWIRSFNDKVQNCNLIEVDFGFEDIKQQEQSFVNSLQWIVSGMNGIQLSVSYSSNQILEQNQLQNQKQDIFQSSFLQDIENDNQNKQSKQNLEPDKQNNQNDYLNKNLTQNYKNQIYIEIESQEDIQENEAIEEEQDQIIEEQDNIKQAVQSKPQTPSKFKEKNSFENGSSRGVITRSASKKIAQISPEKQVKNQSQGQEKANIWNDCCNFQQMNDAIFISNSIEQQNSPKKNNTILQKELLEINSNSSSLINLHKDSNKDSQLKKLIKREAINEKNQKSQKGIQANKCNENFQIKKNIQIVKHSDIASSSIKLNSITSTITTTNNNNNYNQLNQNSQLQKSILSKMKSEFSQPIPRINSGQGSSLSKTGNNDNSNKNKYNTKYKQNLQMELEKEVIIISPIETNIMSSSGISSQRSPNNSCIIVKQNKISKKIVKEDKNGLNQHKSRDVHKINSNGSVSSQTQQKIQKRRIVKN